MTDDATIKDNSDWDGELKKIEQYFSLLHAAFLRLIINLELTIGSFNNKDSLIMV